METIVEKESDKPANSANSAGTSAAEQPRGTASAASRR
jgi:hypothetical protein